MKRREVVVRHVAFVPPDADVGPRLGLRKQPSVAEVALEDDARTGIHGREIARHVGVERDHPSRILVGRAVGFARE
ncbi:hypothetical protein [Haladaptatus sp. R4]|uniref:hypothetical protein n=1 Tax=Haladaptatus sp. R4 TaxID=1679489 RepID=UPI001CBAA5A3|nr:hypothetical protein [Haladaptatus sp. R4]